MSSPLRFPKSRLYFFFFFPSLFDGFADGLGVAEAISYVDPQFLTYMALEERLAQAMEVF